MSFLLDSFHRRCLAYKTLSPPAPTRKQSIMEYNGAAILAMTGKNCVAIARYGRCNVLGAVRISRCYAPLPSLIVLLTPIFWGAPCSDTRLGIQGQTVATDFQKVFKMHDRLFIGLAGLASDVQTL